MKRAIHLKTFIEEDQKMFAYFIDPPITNEMPLRYVAFKEYFLIGITFSPSEMGCVLRVWSLNEKLQLKDIISFERHMHHLHGYDPETQDPIPVLKVFGYELHKIENAIELHSDKAKLLEEYSLFLEKNDYMDIDWRSEPPYSIDEFLKKS